MKSFGKRSRRRDYTLSRRRYSRTRRSGSPVVRRSLITATASAPAFNTSGADSSVIAPIATTGICRVRAPTARYADARSTSVQPARPATSASRMAHNLGIQDSGFGIRISLDRLSEAAGPRAGEEAIHERRAQLAGHELWIAEDAQVQRDA